MRVGWNVRYGKVRYRVEMANHLWVGGLGFSLAEEGRSEVS
jgi:hypothetical protein